MIRTLIITGDGPNLLEDMALVPDLDAYDILAVNESCDRYPHPIRYMATYHPEFIVKRVADKRREAGGNMDYRVIAHKAFEGVDTIIKDWWRPSGSSSLLGIQAALMVLGYGRVILCGCPLEGPDRAGKPNLYEPYRKGYEARKKEMQGRVKSMSGWTRDFLGSPSLTAAESVAA
jgi:hypothetical protein